MTTENSAAKKKDCGCRPKSRPALSPEDALKLASAIACAERVSICNVCPNASKDMARCEKADKPLPEVIIENACPLKRHPDKDGSVRLYGLTFNGVPLPLRHAAVLQAERRGANARLIPFFNGCGCIASLKRRTDDWKAKGGIRAFFAARIEAAADALSSSIAEAIDDYHFNTRPLQGKPIAPPPPTTIIPIQATVPIRKSTAEELQQLNALISRTVANNGDIVHAVETFTRKQFGAEKVIPRQEADRATD